jgi:hypothetical protein
MRARTDGSCAFRPAIHDRRGRRHARDRSPLPHGPDRRGMGAPRALAGEAPQPRAAAEVAEAARRRRRLLPAPVGLPLAAPAARLPALADRLHPVPALAARRHAARRARPLARAGPPRRGPGPRAERRDPGQPDGQDDRGRRAGPRVRWRQAGEGPQAARPGRHARPGPAGPRARGRRPGPRRGSSAARRHG